MVLLEQYAWPGNIRQLENVIERLVIMTENNLVSTRDIELILTEEALIDSASDYRTTLRTPMPTMFGRPYTRVREQDRQHIMDALQLAGGNKTQAAKQLGLTARQLHYRLSKLEIRT